MLAWKPLSRIKQSIFLALLCVFANYFKYCFCMCCTWFILSLLVGIKLKNSDKKKKQLFVSSSAESVGATSRCPFNTCDVFSSFQVLCRVRCSSPLAMAHIFQTTVPLQDTIPKCPIKLLLHIWIISTEPVTTLVTIQHQHKML